MEKHANKFEKSTGKSHLDKEFVEELKHKLWSTKGSRFRASERLKIKNRYSLLSISFLSAYLIIFGLLSVYNLYNPIDFPINFIPFSITSISIFLLVFSLFENSKCYAIRAHEYHQCALEISKLYNELQIFKSYRAEVSNDEKQSFSSSLQDRYQIILEKYENHEQVDNRIFKLAHKDYYEYLNLYDRMEIRIRYFMGTYFLYLTSMIIPGVLLAYILVHLFLNSSQHSLCLQLWDMVC